MKPIKYLLLQMALEGICLDAINFLIRLDLSSNDLPLVIYAQTSDGERAFYPRADLPQELIQELARAAAASSFPDVTDLQNLLEARGIRSISGHFTTYIFPPIYSLAQAPLVERLPSHDPQVQAFGFGGFSQDVYAIVQDGAILSACVSSRQNEESAEAWVMTDPAQRGKGLARQVVTAWARDLLNAGLTPFYSHKVQNLASARLAAALELSQVFEEVVLEGDFR